MSQLGSFQLDEIKLHDEPSLKSLVSESLVSWIECRCVKEKSCGRKGTKREYSLAILPCKRVSRFGDSVCGEAGDAWEGSEDAEKRNDSATNRLRALIAVFGGR